MKKKTRPRKSTKKPFEIVPEAFFSVRLFGDAKVTLSYPNPKGDKEITLSGGQEKIIRVSTKEEEICSAN